MFLSTKTYSPERGFSCAFRQWRATHSHCSKLHGYALGFKFTFAATDLDDRNWVMDFGGLGNMKDELAKHFDHKCAVAQDDPEIAEFVRLSRANIIDMVIFPRVGCEAFAEIGAKIAAGELVRQKMDSRVWVAQVECFEHSGNSAIFIPNTNLYPGFPTNGS